MPKATHTHTTGCAVAPSRRHLVGGTVLAALTGAAFGAAVVLPDLREAAENPDAELIGLCAEFDTLERAYQATDFTCTPNTPEDLASDAERSRITLAQVPVLNRMTELQAVTHAAHVARARSLALWKPDLLEDGPGDFGECLISAIVRDLLAEA